MLTMESVGKMKKQSILWLSLVLVLSGCASTEIKTQPSAPPSLSPSTSSEPSNENSLPSSGDLKGENISFTCEDFVTPENLYDYNPNLALSSQKSSIESSSFPSSMKVLGGIQCNYINLSSSEGIETAIAKVSSEQTSDLSKIVSQQGNPATVSFAADASSFFTFEGKGCISLAIDSYWVISCSPWFQSASDAEEFLKTGLSRLSSL